jgi:Carboxypeptidase regulatory-like domain
MAEIRWHWFRPLAAVLALMAMSAGRHALAQAGGPASIGNGAGALAGISAGQDLSGTIEGRLTDLHSTPLDGATVVVRNEATGAEARTTTTKNGAYRFTGLESGEYTLEAESVRLGRGQLEGIFVAAGHEARVQTAMEMELPPLRMIQTASHTIATVTPELAVTMSAEPLQTLPLAGRFLLPGVPQNFAPVDPLVTAPVLTAVLPSETMATWPLISRTLPVRAQPTLVREGPALTAPALTVMLVSLPLQTLPLVSRALANPQLAANRDEALVALRAKIDPVTPAVATAVSASQLQALPVSGRRWQDFVLDAPTASSAAGGQSQIALRGAGQEPVDICPAIRTTRRRWAQQTGI